jgi:uncharacterized protein YdaU (DUF1376 family)
VNADRLKLVVPGQAFSRVPSRQYGTNRHPQRLTGGYTAYPYYPFYPGDYLRDTRRLTLAQHGAYHLLIHEYMTTGKPLEGDLDAMCRICGALSDDERKAVEFVLREFFMDEGMWWRHGRCDKELNKMEERSAAARESISHRWGGKRLKDG